MIFTSSIDEIWVLGYAAFIMTGAILLVIGLPIYSEKVQTVKESTEVYEVCRYSDNEYFQANTAGNSITIRVKTKLDLERETEYNTEQSDTVAKGQKKSGTVEYQKCGSQNDANAKYCISCGAQITTERKCAECGQVLEESAKYCQKCGKKVE